MIIQSLFSYSWDFISLRKVLRNRRAEDIRIINFYFSEFSSDIVRQCPCPLQNKHGKFRGQEFFWDEIADLRLSMKNVVLMFSYNCTAMYKLKRMVN